MIRFAENLENERQKLYAPSLLYEKIVNSFLQGKSIKVTDSGDLRIDSSTTPEKTFTPQQLSSGEKQILILLTQALICEAEPVVYVADEPELSLHVTWQEKLLESLFSLGKQIQIIVATHSPDIVGPFRNKVIDLGRM